MNIFVKEFAPNSKKDIIFVSGFKTSLRLIAETGASKVRRFIFGLFALMTAPNKRCVPLIEGFSHLNERKGLLILATRFQPHSNYTVTSFDAIRCAIKVSFYGGRGILAFSHLLSYRFLFSAIVMI